MSENIREIGQRFGIPGEIISLENIKNGNINSTYKVTYSSVGEGNVTYVFQRINTYVFKEPRKIMENIDLVTSHIAKKSGERTMLSFLRNADGDNYISTDDGFWRVMNYIDSFTFDTCDDLGNNEATGDAFGEFQVLLSDLDGSRLHETIPDFHNTRRRLDTLFESTKADSAGRKSKALEELDYIHTVGDLACSLWDRYVVGDFPVRVTHNDTKSNNVLFDKETLKPLCVIDLDTVMPGMAMYDFGDAVRSSCSTAAEDERDLTKVELDTEKFTAFCRGYMRQVKHALTKVEIQSLVLGVFSITVELAARFLTDFLDGDKYFKVDYPEHNLVRARCQLKLAKDIVSKCDILNQILRDETE